MRSRQLLSFALAALLGVLAPQASFAINITVSGALGDLDGNGDSGNGEAAVVQAVAACWAVRVPTNRNFTLSVQGGPLSGGGIGQGAVSASDANGIPTAGGLTMDNDGSTIFFVDPTPTDSSEFPTDDPSSPWRLRGGTAVDLFSTVLHEAGHTLAWVCGPNSCGFPNPRYDTLLNPQPGNFVASATCVAPFPVRGQPVLAGCVHLQGNSYDVPLRGDGLGDVVNDLSHPGITGDLMLGFYSNNARETMSVEDVDVFRVAYGDAVNLPPTVNAGTDILSECNTALGSNVSLSGSGSTDPENSPLTYAWTCPSITLSGGNTASPSGFFPIGSSVNCRLDLSDVAACPPDADFVRVQVVDTTAPSVVCPADVVAECTGNNGAQATDPPIPGFLSGASASDICDPSLAITNNAPSFFPLGDTPVTFSTTDDSFNSGSCSANVKVEDTLDPSIQVTLNRTKLWPPNHKLVAIHAEVTVDDVCDPSPTFVLTSAMSDEPDDGLGDGDTAFDIQAASFGTPDTEFDLRSERSGTGDGRTYTLVYTVSDGSGNTAQASATVIVPKDQKGWANSGRGFNLTGTEFVPRTKTYDVVIPSNPFLDARRIAVATIQVGNTRGLVPALQSRITDANGDGLADLIVTFSAAASNQVRSLSTADEPLALRYETIEGTGFLLENIFALGNPIRYKN